MKLSKAQLKALEAVENGMFMVVDNNGKRTFFADSDDIPRLSTMTAANIEACTVAKYKWRNPKGHAVYDIELTTAGRKVLEEARLEALACAAGAGDYSAHEDADNSANMLPPPATPYPRWSLR